MSMCSENAMTKHIYTHRRRVVKFVGGGLYPFQEDTFMSFWEVMIQTGGLKFRLGRGG